GDRKPEPARGPKSPFKNCYRGTADTEKAKGKLQKAKWKDEKPAVSRLPLLPFASCLLPSSSLCLRWLIFGSAFRRGACLLARGLDDDVVDEARLADVRGERYQHRAVFGDALELLHRLGVNNADVLDARERLRVDRKSVV